MPILLHAPLSTYSQQLWPSILFSPVIRVLHHRVQRTLQGKHGLQAKHLSAMIVIDAHHADTLSKPSNMCQGLSELLSRNRRYSMYALSGHACRCKPRTNAHSTSRQPTRPQPKLRKQRLRPLLRRQQRRQRLPVPQTRLTAVRLPSLRSRPEQLLPTPPKPQVLYLQSGARVLPCGSPSESPVFTTSGSWVTVRPPLELLPLHACGSSLCGLEALTAS